MIVPAPASPSSFLIPVPSDKSSAHVLWVALAYFLDRLSVLRNALASSLLVAVPPLTEYFDPLSDTTFSTCFISRTDWP